VGRVSITRVASRREPDSCEIWPTCTRRSARAPRTNGYRLGGNDFQQLAARGPWLQDIRRLNVACTRPRRARSWWAMPKPFATSRVWS
jgi:hypothetical protein